MRKAPRSRAGVDGFVLGRMLMRVVLDENLKRQRVMLDENLKRQRVTWSASQNRVDVKNEKLRKRHLELVIARVMRAQAAAAAA